MFWGKLTEKVENQAGANKTFVPKRKKYWDLFDFFLDLNYNLAIQMPINITFYR